MGVTNTAASVMGFVAPYVVGLLLSAGVSLRHNFPDTCLSKKEKGHFMKFDLI